VQAVQHKTALQYCARSAAKHSPALPLFDLATPHKQHSATLASLRLPTSSSACFRHCISARDPQSLPAKCSSHAHVLIVCLGLQS